MKVKVAKQDVKRFNEIIADFTEWMKEFTPEEEPEKLQEIEIPDLSTSYMPDYLRDWMQQVTEAVNQLVKEREQ